MIDSASSPPPAASSKIRLSRGEWLVLGFTLLYLGAWLAVSAKLANREFQFYFVVMCLLVIGVGLVHLRIRFPLAVLWGLSLWGLAHMAGGLLPIPADWPRHGESRVLYNWWLIPGRLKYDQVVHAYGFGLVTWICWLMLRAAFRRRGVAVQPSLGLLVLCAAGGMGFGAANELVEFVATQTIPGTNVGGYQNTGWDLVANAIGATIAAVSIKIFAPRD